MTKNHGRTRLLGIGLAQPPLSLDQSAAAEKAKTVVYENPQADRLLPKLFRRAGVRRRASVLFERQADGAVEQGFYWPARDHDDRGPSTEQRMQRYLREAPPLAVRAGREALENSRTPPERITHLVTVSCTGFFAPGIDVTLIKRLELPPSVGRVQVGFMGCHGALNGMRVARALVEADPQARPLLCAVELCSLHYQYGWDSEQIVANALFADGAAAAVLGAGGERRDDWRVAASGSFLMPDSEDAMTWRIGDHGFAMTLSPKAPEVIGGHLKPWLESWLGDNGYRLDQIGSWAVHPGGPRIVSSVEEALGLSEEATRASHEVLAEHGNMSSPTVLYVVRRLQESGVSRPCVALAFGPGLMVEAALFF